MLTQAIAALCMGLTASPATSTSLDVHLKKDWAVKADYIEACSCSMFCSCYFNDHPEGGMKCEFNNAVRLAQANVGDVKLDGKKFWLSGDLGGDFTKPLKSAVVTFEPGTTQAEKDAIVFLIG